MYARRPPPHIHPATPRGARTAREAWPGRFSPGLGSCAAGAAIAAPMRRGSGAGGGGSRAARRLGPAPNPRLHYSTDASLRAQRREQRGRRRLYRYGMKYWIPSLPAPSAADAAREPTHALETNICTNASVSTPARFVGVAYLSGETLGSQKSSTVRIVNAAKCATCS